MRFGVLGPLAVWTSGGAPVTVPGVKVRALLADLLVHAGRPVPADQLVEDLWTDRPPGNPAAALQVKVSQLRRALDEAEPGSRQLVAGRQPGYQLLVTAGTVDADRFAELTGRARAATGARERADLLTEALALWRGAAFADFRDEPFAEAAAARLEQDRLVATEEQAEALLALGEHRQLAGRLTDLVARHPLRERLRAAQLRALYGAGRQSEALASFHDLRRRLADELGVDPSPELTALYQAMLNQDPALDATAPPPTNLPAPLTELVGRDAAVADVCALVAAGRLVTLTGPGGVGKTQLAVAAAGRLLDTFPDGVWLVELAGVRAAVPEAVTETMPDAAARAAPETVAETAAGTMPETVAETAAEAVTETAAETALAVLGVREDTAGQPAPARSRLAAALRDRRLLLVLDNCEHVVGPVAGLAAGLLAAAPRLHVLATSREPLALAGERVWPVAPLDLPAPAADADPRELLRSSAVRLFVARAAAAAHGFALDAGNAGAVAALCRRLDGLPLALELAATKVRALGVHALADRLDDRFRLLASGHRGGPARQQTLGAVIDWSWQLLTEPERAVLRRLAVHADGCTLEAAERVCAGGPVPPADVPDLLARLVDRSLVVAADRPDGRRYRLLESVADYCLGRLEAAGELDEARAAHRRHYTEQAERAAERLRGAEQPHWLRLLDAEAANLRRALESAVATGDAGLALRLVNALAWSWFLRGRLTEARRSLAAALAVEGGPGADRAMAAAWQAGIGMLAGHRPDPPPAELFHRIADPAARATAQWFVGFVGFNLGDLAASENLVNSALESFRSIGDRWGTAAALSTLAMHAYTRGDLAALGDCSTRSLELFRELGDRWGQLQASEWLAGLAEINGDYAGAQRLHRDGLLLAEELGLWPQAADRLTWLGRVAMLRGDHAAARELVGRGMRLAAEHSYQPGQIFGEMILGLVARREGCLDEAERRLRAVLRWNSEPGVALTLSLAELGFVAELRGDAAQARTLHLDGLAVAQKLGDPRAVALALEGLAGALTLAGRADPAARLLGCAAAARESAGAPLAAAERTDLDRITAATEGALGRPRFAAEFARGRTLHPQDAAALA